jgi:hypothetical protein
MSILAANPAASLLLSLCVVERADLSAHSCNGGGELRSSYGGNASANRAAIEADFRSPSVDENFASACVCRYVSRLVLGHCFGACPAPSGTASFCFGFAALRVMVPP